MRKNIANGLKNGGYAIEEGPGNKKEDYQDGSDSGIDKRDNEMTK